MGSRWTGYVCKLPNRKKKNYMKFNVLLSVLRSSPDALHCRMELELHMDTVKDNI